MSCEHRMRNDFLRDVLRSATLTSTLLYKKINGNNHFEQNKIVNESICVTINGVRASLADCMRGHFNFI